MTSRKRSSGNDLDSSAQPKKAKVSASESVTGKIDANGDRFWEISRMRRVTISSFRGKTLVGVREYYEKDGQELPGKKGISMPLDQFSSLITILPDIEQALKQNGVSLPRPVYSDNVDPSDEGDEADQEDSGEGKSSPKQNIEATSEEEESEA
ncbi:ssDNA-binding transcriptional regulator [Penicillium alfredii]|uniref:SsDNA-binding transcriptional regulator n=1 Tax=Penicillium alfredii TaxID=1506179 RepID=A0A9W9JX51_9EURO|nr:ssDNA-binding transcriptional regulator [Penicillium alfredii]KAJ5084302.1 ssDNA-binding transcriptional regulator [Penicillium alfredii]